jgi:Transposase domain (DUF772)
MTTTGRPPLPTRLMAGLAILKHTYDLSHEVLCERWVENPITSSSAARSSSSIASRGFHGVEYCSCMKDTSQSIEKRSGSVLIMFKGVKIRHHFLRIA